MTVKWKATDFRGLTVRAAEYNVDSRVPGLFDWRSAHCLGTGMDPHQVAEALDLLGLDLDPALPLAPP